MTIVKKQQPLDALRKNAYQHYNMLSIVIL